MNHGLLFAWLLSALVSGWKQPVLPLAASADVARVVVAERGQLAGFNCPFQLSWIQPAAQLYCFDLDRIADRAASWRDPNYRYFTGSITFDPSCGQVQLAVVDSVVLGDCSTKLFATLYRKFFAVDAAGGILDTTQVLRFWLPENSELRRVSDVSMIGCNPASLPTPAVAPFWISFFGDTVRLGAEVCGGKFQATQTVVTPCQQQRQTSYFFRWEPACPTLPAWLDTVQVRQGDWTPPTMQFRNNPISLPLGPLACEAILPTSAAGLAEVIGLSISDCALRSVQIQLKTWQARGIDSAFVVGNYPLVNGNLTKIPPGRHRLIAVATDACGNVHRDSAILLVADRSAPLITCPGQQTLTLVGGTATLEARVVASGATDNCQIATTQVRRLVTRSCLAVYDRNRNGQLDVGDGLVAENGLFFTPWSASVAFNCCDQTNARNQVDLQVRDLAGNTSRCSFDVLVTDPTLPQAVPPRDTVVACSDPNLWDPAAYGMARVVDNTCGQIVVEELAPIEELDNCGTGRIIRRWRAVKFPNTTRVQRGPEVRQVITIRPERNYSLRFPADVSLDCANLSQAEGVQIESSDCDLLAVSSRDVRSAGTGSSCFNILRTYFVVNWCEYRESAQAVQIDRDVFRDGQRGAKPFWLLVRPNGVTYLDTDSDETNGNPGPLGYVRNSVTDPKLAATGSWEYTQIIRVTDQVAPAITATDGQRFPGRYGDCTGDVTLAFTLTELCATEGLSIQVKLDRNSDGQVDQELPPNAVAGTYPRYRIQGRFPIGSHTFLLEVTDGCGNVGRRNLNFAVFDAQGPTPYCVNGLEVTLNPVAPNTDADGDGDIDRGAATIFTSDLIAREGADCSGNLRYSIYKSDAIESGAVTPEPGKNSLVVTCDDMPSVLVYVYAWDPWGNSQYCESYIFVNDARFKTCPQPGQAALEGNIRTYTNFPVPNIQVQLGGNLRTRDTTDAAGHFAFPALEGGQDYTVTPVSPNDFSNGVTTYDLVMLTKHILNEIPLTSPYQFIAGDIDRSGSITTLDVLLLRRLVLRLDLQLSRNTSWRFIDANYRFPDPSNPFLEPLPASRRVNRLDGQNLGIDFIGVKIGDINGNADLDGVGIRPLPRHTTAPWELQVVERPATGGRARQLAFLAPQAGRFTGLQGSLQFDPQVVTWSTLRPGLLHEEDFGGQDLESGVLHWSWVPANHPSPVVGGDTLFFLELQAPGLSAAASLEPYLHWAKRGLAPEVYDEQGMVHPLQLNWGDKTTPPTAAWGYSLAQNRPNPFQEGTIIEFVLPQPETATLTVCDAAGRKLWEQTQTYPAGQHQLNFQPSELTVSGLLFYTLQTPHFRSTRRMLLQR